MVNLKTASVATIFRVEQLPVKEVFFYGYKIDKSFGWTPAKITL